MGIPTIMSAERSFLIKPQKVVVLPRGLQRVKKPLFWLQPEEKFVSPEGPEEKFSVSEGPEEICANTTNGKNKKNINTTVEMPAKIVCFVKIVRMKSIVTASALSAQPPPLLGRVVIGRLSPILSWSQIYYSSLVGSGQATHGQ